MMREFNELFHAFDAHLRFPATTPTGTPRSSRRRSSRSSPVVTFIVSSLVGVLLALSLINENICSSTGCPRPTATGGASTCSGGSRWRRRCSRSRARSRRTRRGRRSPTRSSAASRSTRTTCPTTAARPHARRLPGVCAPLPVQAHHPAPGVPRLRHDADPPDLRDAVPRRRDPRVRAHVHCPRRGRRPRLLLRPSTLRATATSGTARPSTRPSRSAARRQDGAGVPTSSRSTRRGAPTTTPATPATRSFTTSRRATGWRRRATPPPPTPTPPPPPPPPPRERAAARRARRRRRRRRERDERGGAEHAGPLGLAARSVPRSRHARGMGSAAIGARSRRRSSSSLAIVAALSTHPGADSLAALSHGLAGSGGSAGGAPPPPPPARPTRGAALAGAVSAASAAAMEATTANISRASTPRSTCGWTRTSRATRTRRRAVARGVKGSAPCTT